MMRHEKLLITKHAYNYLSTNFEPKLWASDHHGKRMIHATDAINFSMYAALVRAYADYNKIVGPHAIFGPMHCGRYYELEKEISIITKFVRNINSVHNPGGQEMVLGLMDQAIEKFQQ